jgi:hypothetical protein
MLQSLINKLGPVLTVTLGLMLVVLLILAVGVVIAILDRDDSGRKGFEVKQTTGGESPVLREKENDHG